MLENKKCLITGGSGFVGQTLAKILNENGWKVTIFDLIEPDFQGSFKFLKGDLRSVNDCLKATKDIDVVFHNAAIVPLGKNSKLITDVNILGTANLLEACSKNRVKKFVYTSSSAIYGVPYELPVTLKTIAQPIEIYGESKMKAEQVCLNFEKKDFTLHIVRPRTILGPGRLGLFGTFYEWIDNGKFIFMLGKNNPRYQFIHVDDLCQALMRVAEIDEDTTLNLGALDFGNLEDEFRSLSNLYAKDLKILHLPERFFRRLLLLLSRIKLLPFAPYQIKLFGKSFYFDSKPDWEKINYYPHYSNLQCLISGFDYYLGNKDSKLNSKKSFHTKGLDSVILNSFNKLLSRLVK